ncbi:uncharacterized protein LOC130765375 isoform X2 [Actinidia eriantha]|uniref:uncharacterized protein LOC130765375 isoform X2 n=1 Tax=Actinidia eriantha TaxID=165200 RepID=UPI0025862AAE|nr:uncharacterized protein LOC130765375 isoform X2 [Actinidia eriantha]
MLRHDFCSLRILSHFREESGDEELSVLPRHTKVVVTGNNRTKSVLVGLQGVVKKAVGLGGWHWLVLKNGAEVKLQRNALSVVEPPTDNEENGDFDNSSSDSDIGHKYNDISSGKLSKPRVRYAKPLVPSALAKTINCSSFKDVQTNVQATRSSVNLAKLGSKTLWRYWRAFNLTPSPNLTKEQLANAAQQHFCLQQVDEFQVITEFIHAAKRRKAADANIE